MELTDQILKQDSAGRVWTPRARREAIVDEFERSGLPATRFAAQIGVKYQTLVSWVQKRRKQRATAGEKTIHAPRLGGWVEALVEPAPSTGAEALTVQLPGGARLEVRTATHAQLAAQLLRHWMGGGGC